MPTGYTAGVADGSTKTFKEFALLCARAMGATILLRDEPLSSEIPEFEVSSYHQERLQEALARKAELENMTPEQCEANAEADFNQALSYYNAQIDENRARRERYHSMLKQAEAFEPPTEQHVRHKEFMLQQLRDSMNFDCSIDSLEEPRRRSGNEWLQKQLGGIRWNIDYHTKGHSEEVARTEERNAWVNALKEALDNHDVPA